MTLRGIVVGALALLAAFPALAATPDPAAPAPRRIAITFDDAPRPGSHFAGPERARRLLAALESARVEATFFCNTSRFDAEGRARIEAYHAAGHLIANHSHAHPDLHRIGAEAFLADFRQSAAVLDGLPDARRWFRYPYLHEGRTAEERDAVRTALVEAGYRPGYVTVDNYDWYLDVLFQEAVAAHPEVDLDRWRAAYVEILLDAVEFYDGIAREALGRSPVHVLLLHENDLAALFITDLAAALRAHGWEIVSAEEAYADPIATQEPKTLRLNQGRVVALAIDRGHAFARSRWEEEDDIRAELKRRGLLE